MGCPIVHFEVMGPDGNELEGFYAEVFGWRRNESISLDEYAILDTASGSLSGGIGTGPAERPRYLTMYIEVPDIEAHLARVVAMGGTTLLPRTVVPDMATFALFADPAGNTVGLVEG